MSMCFSTRYFGGVVGSATLILPYAFVICALQRGVLGSFGGHATDTPRTHLGWVGADREKLHSYCGW